jgi:hypothetical protein
MNTPNRIMFGMIAIMNNSILNAVKTNQRMGKLKEKKKEKALYKLYSAYGYFYIEMMRSKKILKF